MPHNIRIPTTNPSFFTRSDVAEGIPVDNQNFVHLVSCTQLMARELRKCKRLIQTLPVDMTEYYGELNRNIY